MSLPNLLVVLLSDALDDILDGNLFRGIMMPLTDLIGSWAYAVLFSVMFGMMMFRTDNAIIPAVVFLLIGPVVFFFVPPAAHTIYYIFVVLAITGSIFKAYTPKGG